MHAQALSHVQLFGDPMDYSPQGFSVHGIFQARIVERFVISFSRGSSWPRDRTQVSCVSCTGRRILYRPRHLGAWFQMPPTLAQSILTALSRWMNLGVTFNILYLSLFIHNMRLVIVPISKLLIMWELTRYFIYTYFWGLSDGSAVKNLPAMQETQETRVWSLGWEDPLEEGMATHSSIFAWKIPWTEEPGGLQSIGSLRGGHDWSDYAHTHT